VNVVAIFFVFFTRASAPLIRSVILAMVNFDSDFYRFDFEEVIFLARPSDKIKNRFGRNDRKVGKMLFEPIVHLGIRCFRVEFQLGFYKTFIRFRRFAVYTDVFGPSLSTYMNVFKFINS
jgi:hypothetical protein